MNSTQPQYSSIATLDFYDLIALIYDSHWGRDFFPEALGQFRLRLKPRVRPNATVLDLCCGSGRFAAYLSSAGYGVTGVDSSAELLAEASERAPRARLIRADMSDFRTGQRYDAAVCFYNALNHARDESELRRIFDNVASHIVDGGYFLFDVISETELSYWGGEEYVLSADMLYELTYSYLPATRTATCRVRVRSRQDPDYVEAEAISEQRPIDASVIRAALRSAGFCVVLVKEFRRRRDADGRLIVLAKRLHPHGDAGANK
jgi:SAM-dependent methyltransferase